MLRLNKFHDEMFFVSPQINHMKRFIEQEAQEKAEEIMIKVHKEVVASE